MTLKDRIVEYCRQRPFEWVHKGTIGRLAVLEWGYENENSGRRCRELENEGVLEVRIIKGCAEYRYIPIMQQIRREEPKPTPSLVAAGKTGMLI